MVVRACRDRRHASHDIRIDYISKDPLDRQFGRKMGGQLDQAAR